ncbi:CHAT domain-containing protein [Suillus lakei]|nr:CHAT domain-containing protein [Suillus lakei]
MARQQRIGLESSGSSESDFSSASSPSPNPSVEKSASSTEPLAGGKLKHELSNNDNDNMPKGSKRPRSQKKDITKDSVNLDPSMSHMSSFVPGHFDDYPPPVGEEPSHSECHQDPGQTNLNVVPDPLDDTLSALGEEPNHPEHTQDPEHTRLSGVQQVVITAIRATDLAFGLRRIPPGFHVVVKADGTECQTSNKPVHVDQAVVEWNERILLPCEPSSKVRVSVYASFELGPMLCRGEVLRTFEISVGELLDRSEKSHPIVFQPKQEEVVSPCTSLFVTVEQRFSDENDAAVLCPLTTLMSNEMDALVLRTDAGHRLLARYRRTQNNRDLGQSINHFERASDLCLIGNPYRPAALFNLATAKFVGCQADGRYLDLDLPISLFQDALDLRPTGHPDRTVTQLHLAIALLSRFAKRGFQTDADAAEELLNEVLDVCHANSHIHRAALLAIETSALHSARSIDANDPGQEWPAASMLPLSPNQLGDLVKWCMQRDDPGALDEVISLHYDALRYYNTMHACRGQLLGNLSIMLATRFKRRGNDEDLDQATALQREVLALHPVGHTDRSKSLNNLANHLSTHFSHRGNDEDLDQAIALLREALALHPVGHTDRSLSLNNLATHLSTRFSHRGNDEDLDQAIALDREALALRPVGHTGRSSSLITSRINSHPLSHRGNDEDLDQAIALVREALALLPVGHTDRSLSLNNLANQLSTRFSHRGNDEDLDQGIALHREALALRPVGHTERSSSLSNDEDLDQAIALDREALALRPVGHTDRSKSLNNLANQLSTRFSHRGNDEDLDQGIALHREALALHPVGHTDRSKSLNNLANQLFARFLHQGNDEDLDQAIALQREALALHPVGHTDRSKSLSNLAIELSTRFLHRGNDEDLDQAIALHREALALRPVGHTGRSSSLNNLANQLFTRFSHRGNDEDLDQGIALHREALALHPVGHTYRSSSLSNLAAHLSTRFSHRGNDEDLDQAIALQREALALRPVGHTGRSSSLNNLANQLSTRFDYRRNGEDLSESREILHCALTLLTQHDPRQLQVHKTLANVYLLFYRSGLDPGEDTDSLNAVMHHLKAAVNVVSGGLLSRLQASLLWVHHADQHAHGTQLEAYATSMQLLDAHMSATASVWSRHSTMKEFPRTLAVDAASCALRSGDVRRAVELLEQGRTLIWTQMARLRTPLDNLQTCGDHAVTLMKRFRDLSSLLEKPPASHADETPKVDVDAEETRYRRLVEEWHRAVEEIRNIEDFSRFLLPPLFSDLQEAARDGPIIMLVASKSSCDAVIIPHSQPPISIQLPTTLEKLQALAVKLQCTSEQALKTVLTELWDDVVRPAVKNLGGFAQPGSRIWWCPTSVFNSLPLHAAGEYSRKHGQLLSRLYISSYTPSLTALIKARKSLDRSLPVSFAAIGQNLPNGYSHPLKAVEGELDLVQSLIPPFPTVSFTKITSVDATKSRALCALRDNTWLHFACHGTQNLTEPFKSAFLMRDHPLSLLDITQMDLSRHEFVFLSACETAVGDPSTPDEVIHLAAGLQFAGVQSVVGTLWEVDDGTVGHIVNAFYRNLCGDGKMNSKRAARALHRAVQSLASDEDIPLEQRIVFIHIGI